MPAGDLAVPQEDHTLIIILIKYVDRFVYCPEGERRELPKARIIVPPFGVSCCGCS